MNDKQTDQDTFRTFQLMNEIESGQAVSQRELASRLGIAVGLVNSYLKNFVAKGFIRVKSFPRNRYAYLLTPKGFSEKSRLAYQHISYFTSLYTTTRQAYQDLFSQLAKQSVDKVIFVGVDEVAEIAYLSLQEMGLSLIGVHDNDCVGDNFFGYTIQSIEPVEGSVFIISSIKREAHLVNELKKAGVSQDSIACPDGMKLKL